VSFEEKVERHAYEMSALVSVLEKKGLVTREEIVEEIKNIRT